MFEQYPSVISKVQHVIFGCFNAEKYAKTAKIAGDCMSATF